ncbi:MAG: DUF992 domain-containing protein [Hyphomicrobiaceae bacterium]
MATKCMMAALAAIAGTLAVAGLVPAVAQPRIEVGVLSCSVAGGTGFVIGSSKRLECVLDSGPRRETYWGRIDKLGVDVGRTASEVITWAVLAQTRGPLEPGALAGTYAGVSGEATVGVGLGANALVGGSRRSIALQPLSVGAQQGLNLAVGVAALTLESAE